MEAMEVDVDNETEATTALPSLPRLPTDRDQALPEVRDLYLMEFVTILDEWARWREQEQPGLADARAALLDLEQYGLWAVAATQRNQRWWVRPWVAMKRPDGQHRQACALLNWFWEWMHLRRYVAVREAEAVPEQRELAEQRVQIAYPTTVRWRLAVARASPIAQWTQSELNMALEALLVRWQTAPWHEEFWGYVHSLLDRLATLGWTSFPAAVLDLEDGRELGLPESEPAPYVINLDWQYRSALRTCYLLRALYLQQQAGDRLEPSFQTLQLPRETASSLAPLTVHDLRGVLAARTRAAGPDARTHVQAEGLRCAVAPEDAEWLRYVNPMATVVPATILEELHASYKDRVQKMSWRRPHVLLALLDDPSPAARVEQGLAERVLLYFLDGALPAHLTAEGDQLAWSAVHTYPNETLEETRGSRQRRELPALVQWQGRYELVWRGHTYAHPTLYEAVVDWFRIVAVHHAGTHEWRILKPAVAEMVARYRATVAASNHSAVPQPPAQDATGAPEAPNRRPQLVMSFSKRART